MTEIEPRKLGRPPLVRVLPDQPLVPLVDDPIYSGPFGKVEPTEPMVPVKVLRGYWPHAVPGDTELDPNHKKLLVDALCTLPEGEAQEAADKGIVRILTGKGYRDAKEAAATAPPPTAPRTLYIPRT